MRLDAAATTLEVTIASARSRPRTVAIRPGRPGHAAIAVVGRTPGPAVVQDLVERVRWILRLDEDLSGFYALAAADPALSWAAVGAGRLVRGQTVFEEVVKTICTTNCAWSATERMVGALVEHLGEPAVGAPRSGPRGRAFPTPEAMALADDAFYRDVVRAGYRGRYLRDLAARVAGGELDLEPLATVGADELPDDELERVLLGLPGVGPYAAAHVMMLLGRYHRLVLDSWTRPTHARLTGRRARDDAIVRRYRRYGRYAGLAFWLVLTRGWVEEAP
jgi:N-glycosylase/DNA lyase